MYRTLGRPYGLRQLIFLRLIVFLKFFDLLNFYFSEISHRLLAHSFISCVSRSYRACQNGTLISTHFFNMISKIIVIKGIFLLLLIVKCNISYPD